MITRTTQEGKVSLDSLDQDMDAAYEAINRQDAQLDSFNARLSILAKGTLTFSWNGTVAGASTANVTVAHSLGYAPIFLAYYKWSAESGTPWHSTDDTKFDTTGTAQWQIGCQTSAFNFYAQLNAFQAGSSSTFTVAYFLLKEPAQTS